MRLQGVGPKTVAVLYRELRIKSLEDLSAAGKAGRIRAVKGMGAKKEQLILQAIEEQQRHAGRHLLSRATETAEGIVAYLKALAPSADILTLGSVRRGAETCGDLDILATAGAPTTRTLRGGVDDADPSLVDAFVQYPGVERVLGKGGGKASVLMRGGFQADLRIVKPEQRGAAMQYFTGSKAHNIVLRDRALTRGWKLNEYGLFDKDERGIAGATEEGIYHMLGMAFVPPELRENRGEIEAAETNALPRLIEASDLKGDVHMHTTESDGRERLETMAAAAQANGLHYIAITDHTQSLAMANGLDESRTLAHAEKIRTFSKSLTGFAVLAGAEVDILSDGRLDLADECLKQLDVVIVSLHSNLQQDEDDTTRRLIRAIENPYVDIVGHPTARWLLRREGAKFKLEKVIDAAVANGVALEINSQPHRLDLCDSHARLARDKGAKLSINSDAHEVPALNYPRWGILTARRAWLTKEDVINTRPLKQFRAGLRRNR
jgi:DNA polymerase (family 10)